MNLLDRVLAEPELQAKPPVLIDVGAAGGLHRPWRRIARHAIGVGFEPDARETAALAVGSRRFRRWVLCRSLAVPVTPATGAQPFHLTRSPQCSSSLPPNAAALSEWAFAEFFEVTDTRALLAVTLVQALTAEGIDYVDWLKCDTQGLDLKLFQSLPAAWRERLLTVEFEPGLIDAYEGEDKLADVLAAMAGLPFWLAKLEVGWTPRARPAAIDAQFGPGFVRHVRRLAPGAPAWANVMFLRDALVASAGLGRREFLLAWVFATLADQPAYALTLALAGVDRFPDALFADLVAASRRRLRWAMLRRLPIALWGRLVR